MIIDSSNNYWYLSTRPHFLLVYWLKNSRGMLGEEEKFVNHEPKSDLQGEGQKQTGHRD